MTPPAWHPEGSGIRVASRAELKCLKVVILLCWWGFPAGPEAELNLSTRFQGKVGFMVAPWRFGKGFWHRGKGWSRGL